ncbi:carbohydrate ABC transporter permease [Ammoniphilus sp. CFH 90114]|uniref:carbohydrate ABC transporter permease n=1 Tax=Ammoniphilus sp. CFH 90114 TaxID=2493665 RepID=UPI00100F0A51|nr:sugar ABC transporter permease [Ammoniphilus sp. CFH 90114]RXT15540.1 sugar ABC transporter permease [Ammoniphilus sp. CFH 90114]
MEKKVNWLTGTGRGSLPPTRWKKNAFAYSLLLPSMIFLILFTYYPTLKSIYLSFFNSTMGQTEFVGLQQYKQLLEDDIFLKVMKNNLLLAIGTVPTSIFLAIYLAIWLNGKLKANAFLRAAFFYPTVIPMIAIANIWLFIYTPSYGLLDQFLEVFGVKGVNWLGDPSWVMYSMIFMLIWKEAGFFMIFYLAGLQNLPQDVYEAARIEGAKPFQIFRHITFPLLMPTTMFVLIIAVTNSFKLVDHLYIMTKGGPDNASNLLLYYIYETAFSFWDMGKASVLTVVLLVILLAISIFNYAYLDKRIHY